MHRLFLAAVLAVLLPLRAQAAELTIFAAASLTDALKDIAPVWEQDGGAKLRFNFAASSTLARQMEQGAQASVFASADQQWMDWAQTRNLIVPATRKELLGNTLVLVAPRDTAHPVEIKAGMDLEGLLGPGGRIATGDPASVPAGIYARAALTSLNLWGMAKSRIAASDSVRSALLLVERHEAPLGIVYATDAAVAPGVAVVGTFPRSSHPPIVYPFAVGKAADTADARAFLAFLSGPQATAIFRKRGFKTAP